MGERIRGGERNTPSDPAEGVKESERKVKELGRKVFYNNTLSILSPLSPPPPLATFSGRFGPFSRVFARGG